ncbi:hypothetical protein Dsin_004795 [Dipteronia sinensis]|uniref:DUF1985 domain-containing protein n=1 Tax=Dipteronia sinensis TaxID=43782 RepID=A0AAE0EE13_9ROSI|nr:hypothetical protein Dsin_004795 [Dipteronia sinensis]
MQLRNQLKDLLKTSVGEWYEGQITQHDHFDDLRDIDVVLNRVSKHLAIKERRQYIESCFGHFLKMHREMKFSAGKVHRLLMHELHHDGLEDEMRFMSGHHSVRFSKFELCLITRLKFEVIPDTTRYEMVVNGIHQRYFGGRDEVKYVQLRVVLQIGIFEQQYDAVKLCLLYMLNWILMGLDEKEKIPIFAFEVIPELGTQFGTRMEIDLSPRILKWELSKRPRADKLAKIFTLRMFVRTLLVPTAVERAERYYDGIYEGGSLYTIADRVNVAVPDPIDHTTAGTSDTEGSKPTYSHHKGTDLETRHDQQGPPPLASHLSLQGTHLHSAPLQAINRDRVPPHGLPLRSIPALRTLPEVLQGQSPSIATHPSGLSEHAHLQAIPRDRRVHKRGWQPLSLYTDLCRSKWLRTLPASSEHILRLEKLVHGDQLATYKAYKLNMMGEFHGYIFNGGIMPTGVEDKPLKGSDSLQHWTAVLAPGQHRPQCREALSIRPVQIGIANPYQVRADRELKVVFTVDVAWGPVSR